jgi:nicotinate-nucleotide adenylyltransferase
MPRVQPNEPIAVFGGIFNPIHNGHLAVAGLAAAHLGLSAIHLFPSGSPPHKPKGALVSAHHRLTMLRLAVRGDRSLVVHDDELRRQGITYTIDTLIALHGRYPGRKLYFIIGSDNLREIATWHRFREVLAMTTFCVAHRPGSSLNVPLALKGIELVTLPSPEWGISSSMVRAYLARGFRCTGLLPEAVVDYIAEKGLYRRPNPV